MLFSRSRFLRLFAAATLVVGVAVGAGLWYASHHWNQAKTAVADNRPADALPNLQVCLRVWPWSLDVHLLAARADRLLGDFRGAEAHLKRCLELHGGATEAVQLEFYLLRTQTGEVDELSESLFDIVKQGHPESEAVLETIALAYIRDQRYKPASACLSYWIEQYPTNPKPYQHRGWVLERLNNSKVAMADYLKALELDPTLVKTRLRVVEMLIEDKKAPEAAPHLDILYRQAPDDPEVQARVGMCRFLEGRSAEARKLMEAAAPHLPQDAAMHVTLAKLDLQEDRLADAEKRLRAVLAPDPSDTEALFMLASVLRAQGRTTEGDAVTAEFEHKRKVVERINEMLKDVTDKSTPADYVELGEQLLSIGRDSFGVRWLKRALRKDPSNQPAHRLLAAYYERKGDAENADAHRQMIRETPNSPPKKSP